jgi:hypothetical protein
MVCEIQVEFYGKVDFWTSAPRIKTFSRYVCRNTILRKLGVKCLKILKINGHGTPWLLCS